MTLRVRVRGIQSDECGLGLGLFKVMNEVEECSRESRRISSTESRRYIYLYMLEQ